MSFVGVDVGGTKVAAALLADATLHAPHVVPTDKASTAALLDQLVAAVAEVRREDTQAVGVAVPSVVDFAAGRVRYSVNIPLADVSLRDELSGRIGLPVFVDNDATVAALAEATKDGEVVVRNLVILTVGTGVGGGIVLNGRIYRGATGAAAELGHTMIGAQLDAGAPPPREKFPQPGSLEALAAGSALDRLAEEALGAGSTGRDAVAQRHDVVRVLGERLGIGIANMMNALDPDEVVIGGGVSAAGDLLLRPAEETARRYVLPGVGTGTTIRLARHGNEAGVLGAALMARFEWEDG